jgi:hypothetical protein
MLRMVEWRRGLEPYPFASIFTPGRSCEAVCLGLDVPNAHGQYGWSYRKDSTTEAPGHREVVEITSCFSIVRRTLPGVFVMAVLRSFREINAWIGSFGVRQPVHPIALIFTRLEVPFGRDPQLVVSAGDSRLRAQAIARLGPSTSVPSLRAAAWVWGGERT